MLHIISLVPSLLSKDTFVVGHTHVLSQKSASGKNAWESLVSVFQYSSSAAGDAEEAYKTLSSDISPDRVCRSGCSLPGGAGMGQPSR